ncbi:hypothetical protein [Quatrionicoccus australiensis]|uniref:hypothetical protein n=1 Tax=Quatrionicoccus australiensis TaxID=138118 RepID=UPI001CFA0962|nr:hypothetical protein [Quatrionicoccus australiensis]MCB4358450.1 hypothetical protein [Quatrionicoccus australiensis]
MNHISKHIDELIAGWRAKDRELFQESAAIRQFDGNQSRDEAEQGAYAEIRAKVDADKKEMK